MAKWIQPFPESKITGHYGTLSEYRKRKGMQPHSGTDWAMRAGTLIPAITSGTVKLIQYSKILGWVVVQTGWDEKKKKTKYIGYCHLYCSFHGAECKGPAQGCKTPLKSTKVGDKVEVGQKYLRVGNSGSATTGAHLHATLGNTLKSVFSVTSAKEDLYRFIQSQSEGPAPKQAPKKTQAVVEPKVKAKNTQSVAEKAKIVYACPHCKKELK